MTTTMTAAINTAGTITISAATIGCLMAADRQTAETKRLGLQALVSLVRDTQNVRVFHGLAAQTAAILKEGGLEAARAKYYAEKAVQCCAALQLQGVLVAAKAKPDDKATAYADSVAANIDGLASMGSILQAQKWAKDNGPKADKAETPADDKAALPIGPTFAFPGNPDGVFQLLAAMAASIWFAAQKSAFKAAQKEALQKAA